MVPVLGVGKNQHQGFWGVETGRQVFLPPILQKE
jgi:hypothetical protein